MQKIPSLNNLTVDVLTADPPLGAEAILGQFSMYMLTDGKNRKDEGFKVGTLLQYLSGVKTVLAKKFPGTFRDADDEWYSELYSSLDMRGRVMCIRSGKPVSEKTMPMRRGVLVLVGNYLCKESTPDAFETRAAICSIRQACGRGGEVSTSVWDTAYWDEEESLVTLDWREAKTGREDILTIGCDLHDYEICWFHSISFYMIYNPGAFAKIRTIFGGFSLHSLTWSMAVYLKR